MEAYTLPMLLAEWENIGATEPFPMAAADLLLRYMNCTASEDGEYEAGISMRCECDGVAAASLEKPPQRYTRKAAGKRLASIRLMLEVVPSGTAWADPDALSNSPPEGPI